MKKFIPALATILFLAACMKLDKGKIIEKQYQPAYSEIIPQYYFADNETYTYQTVQYHAEEFVIIIQGLDCKGKIVTESLDVSKFVFNSIAVGDSVYLTDPIVVLHEK